ncbi:hypothetical protein [Streptomyces sp. NBC_01443]|uniref:hypothetical protein n=1 Tax=Streptomyces sp. NBC_01443 TaxID=2903868 RepID=UPI002B1CB0DA|nr:hypothetical protein [Streptomyces sp. NBC_01443]
MDPAHALSHLVVDAAVATLRELGPAQPDTLIHGERRAQFQAAFCGRPHGFRIAYSGSRLDWLTALTDRLAELLTERP